MLERFANSPITGSNRRRHRGAARDGPPGGAAVQQDKDPPGEPFWLSAMFWVVGILYVVTVVVNFWSAVCALLD